MLKTLLLVIGGLAAGLAIAYWLQPGGPVSDLGGASRSTSLPRSVAAERDAGDARLEALEDAFEAEVEQRAALEKRVAELAAELESFAAGSSPAAESALDAPVSADDTRTRARFREGEMSGPANERRIVEQLIAGGFAPDRAEWINRRSQELRMQSLQAQYEAMRQVRGFPAGNMQGNETQLRTELGDADYERYLAALGRPTSVDVRDVLASSPAERSGLQPGDEILAYDGKRVFDMRELNALTLEGTAGESVVVDVRRGEQNVQLVMPRGPIGIFGGGFRGR